MQTLYHGTGWASNNNRFRAVDNAGNASSWSSSINIYTDTEAPKKTSWWWGEVNTNVARLYIQASDNASGINRVQCPTSTASGGYNNWVWFNAVWDSGANAWRADITPATFGHYGQTYITRLYLYDNAGNGACIDQTNIGIPTNQLAYIDGGKKQADVGVGAKATLSFNVSDGIYTVLSYHSYVNHGSSTDPQFWHSGNVTRQEQFRWNNGNEYYIVSKYNVVGNATISVATHTEPGGADCAAPIISAEIYKGAVAGVYSYKYTANNESAPAAARAEVSVPSNTNVFAWNISWVGNWGGYKYSGSEGDWNSWNIRENRYPEPGIWSGYTYNTGGNSTHWWETRTTDDSGGPVPRAFTAILTY